MFIMKVLRFIRAREGEGWGEAGLWDEVCDGLWGAVWDPLWGEDWEAAADEDDADGGSAASRESKRGSVGTGSNLALLLFFLAGALGVNPIPPCVCNNPFFFFSFSGLGSRVSGLWTFLVSCCVCVFAANSEHRTSKC